MARSNPAPVPHGLVWTTRILVVGLAICALFGCQTRWTVISDREAVMYAKPDQAIGYEPKARLRPLEPFTFTRPSLRADVSLILIAGDELASVRRRSADPRDIRIRPTDWRPCSSRDRDIVTTMLTTRMTPEEVVAAWGMPDHHGEVITPNLSRTSWTYFTPTDTTCLYFDNGRLTGWSTVPASNPTDLAPGVANDPRRVTRD